MNIKPILKYKEARGFSNKDLADIFGVTQGMITKVLKKEKGFGIKLGFKVAKIIGCSIEDLYKD